MASAAPYFVIAASVATLAKTASDLSKPGVKGASEKQAATPSQVTSDKSNSSDISANILKQEQARKAASTNDTILTGGMGALGNPETSSGSSTLLGL